VTAECVALRVPRERVPGAFACGFHGGG
jgi:hypothetical protein